MRSLHAGRFDQLVRESLVIPVVMVVRGEFSKGRPQVPFAERNEAVQASSFTERTNRSARRDCTSSTNAV